MPVEQDVAPEKPSRIARPGPVDPLADPLRDPIADALRAGSRIPALPVHHRRAAEPPAPPPSEAGDDALADEVLAAASAEAAAPVEQDQEEDDAPPVETWEDYTVDQAHADEDQRFGVEVELKTTEIPYDDTVNELGKKVRGPFHQFAIERGHKAVYKHKRVGIEVHLDQGEADGALLEMVTQAQAGDVLAATLSTLRSELTALKTAADFAKWLSESCTPAATTTADIDQYIRTKLKVSNGQLFPNMVQMTTTLTATQIANMGGDFPQFMVGDAPGGGMSGSKLTRQMFEDAAKRGKSADAVVQGYLANLPAYAKSKGGKGTNALVKHAREQFGGPAPVGLGADTPMSKLRQGGKTPLDQVRTRANKLAPVFKRRSGAIAYVVELRGQDVFTTQIARWLNSDADVDALTPVFQRATIAEPAA